jgi:hypothetical protein
MLVVLYQVYLVHYACFCLVLLKEMRKDWQTSWDIIVYLYIDAVLTLFHKSATVVREEVNSSNEPENIDEQEQIRIARALLNYRLKEKMAMANYPHVSPFPKKFPMQQERKPCLGQSCQSSHSKILPLFRPKPNSRPKSPASTDGVSKTPGRTVESLVDQSPRSRFPAAEAAPYVPVGHYRRIPCHNMAPSVTIRTAVPVFSAPPLPPPPARLQQLPPLMSHPPPIRMASPVRMRPAPASPMFASSSPVQVPKPVMPVQLKDVQDHPRKEAVPLPPVIPVQVKDAQCRPRKSSMSPVIPVPVKDAQRRPAAIPVQMKDVQTQAPKEPLAAPIPAARPSVMTDTPAQVKEASAGATSEAPSSATGNNAAVECSASSETVLARQSGAADEDTLVLMRKLSMRPEAQSAAEAATTMRLETN